MGPLTERVRERPEQAARIIVDQDQQIRDLQADLQRGCGSAPDEKICLDCSKYIRCKTRPTERE